MENNDYTYIEHSMYAWQIENVYKYFNKEQLLVLDYQQLKDNPYQLLETIFSFLNIDKNFQPDLSLKNITGDIKNASLQKALAKKSRLKKLLIKYGIDSWLSPAKKELWKQRLFEMNTSKKTTSKIHKVIKAQDAPGDKKEVAAYLASIFESDTKKLDKLLGTGFYNKWFTKEIVENIQ